MGDATVTDPLGRVIALHDRTWYGHIVRGHPEVADHCGLAEAAIEQPLEIRRSRSGADCRLYFGRGPREHVMLMVVADVRLGLVKTGHLCDRTSGGEVEWSK